MNNKFEQPDQMTISDLETLKVLTDPLRHQILELTMAGPVTVKVLSEKLEIPATKLYYHINLLEKHSLLVVVDTQVVSGIIEKHYQAAAGSFSIDRSLLAFEGDGGGILSLVLDQASSEIRRAVKSGMIHTDPDAEPHQRLTMSKGRTILTPEQANELARRIEELRQEFSNMGEQNSELGEGRQVFTLLTAFFPTEWHPEKSEGSDE